MLVITKIKCSLSPVGQETNGKNLSLDYHCYYAACNINRLCVNIACLSEAGVSLVFQYESRILDSHSV